MHSSQVADRPPEARRAKGGGAARICTGVRKNNIDMELQV